METTTERWLPVDCAPGYEVSDLGRVRNRTKGNILKPHVHSKGYRRVSLGKAGGRFVHRLVATAFIGPGDELEVNHMDGNRANNALSNLEWVNRSQNERHSRYVLGNLCEPVVGFHDNGEVRLFASIAHANAELGLHKDAVRRCMSMDYTRCKSFGWSFIRYSMAGVAFDPAPPTSGLERIDGMEFYLHENPDATEEVEPVRLVMAMSHNDKVFCHRASQGDNGICQPPADESAAELGRRGANLIWHSVMDGYTKTTPADESGAKRCESCDDTGDLTRPDGEWAGKCPHHQPRAAAQDGELTFSDFRAANAARCIKWHPEGIASWSPSDWLTAVTGELGELASLLKMRNRERDGLPGNKFSPTDKMIADELADVLTYLDLLAAVLGVDLGRAAVEKFNEVSERVGFPDRIRLAQPAWDFEDAARKGQVEFDIETVRGYLDDAGHTPDGNAMLALDAIRDAIAARRGNCNA